MSALHPDIAAVLEGRARWCVVCADNRELLPLLPAGAVDHCLSDPPYAARAMKNARSNGETMKQRRDGLIYDFGYAALTPQDRRLVAREIARVTRRWAAIWCDIESDEAWRKLLRRYGHRYLRTAVWHREAGAPQFSGDRPAQDVEACVITHGAEVRLRWNGGGHGASLSQRIVNTQDPLRDIHATPKPYQLVERQVLQFSDPDDLILDPYVGSGTTGCAAVRNGRRFIGLEIDEQHARDARDRIAAESQGLSLRDARAGQLPLLGGV